MFAEACPANPSRVKQQAGVREVSSTLLHHCHRYHVQWCDTRINSGPGSALKHNTSFKKSLQKKKKRSCYFSSLWEGCTVVAYMFSLVRWRPWLGRWWEGRVPVMFWEVVKEGVCWVLPWLHHPCPAQKHVEHTHSVTAGWSRTKTAQSEPFRPKTPVTCQTARAWRSRGEGGYRCRQGGGASQDDISPSNTNISTILGS